MKLYELSGQYIELASMMNDPEIDQQAILDTLEAINGEFDEKADNIACIIKDLRKDEADLKAEAGSLLSRAKAKKISADWFVNYLFQQMEQMGKTEIETTRNLLKIKNNPASVKVEDESTFIAWATLDHEEFLRQKAPEIDKTALKEALKAGHEIPGASLEQGRKLTIK